MTLEAINPTEVMTHTNPKSIEELVHDFELAQADLAIASQAASDADIQFRQAQLALIQSRQAHEEALQRFIDSKEQLRTHGLTDANRARIASELQSRAQFYDSIYHHAHIESD